MYLQQHQKIRYFPRQFWCLMALEFLSGSPVVTLIIHLDKSCHQLIITRTTNMSASSSHNTNKDTITKGANFNLHWTVLKLTSTHQLWCAKQYLGSIKKFPTIDTIILGYKSCWIKIRKSKVVKFPLFFWRRYLLILIALEITIMLLYQLTELITSQRKYWNNLSWKLVPLLGNAAPL